MSWATPSPQPLQAIHYITCVTRRQIPGGHLIKTHLSGPDGTWTYNDVITWIGSGAHRFITLDQWGNSAEIEVHMAPDRTRYLQTVSDGVPTNNLDLLPNC